MFTKSSHKNIFQQSGFCNEIFYVLMVLIVVSASLIILWTSIALASDKPPVIRYASADSGPNNGWPGDNSKGAAITIWAENINETREGSTLTVCGVTLDKDTHFAEWGTNRNPKTTKNTRRITFWLTSQMSGSTGIRVTVNGIDSNTIPFSITETGKIHVYPDDKSARVWDNLDDAAESMKPGDFLYLRGIIDESDILYSGSVRIGYWESSYHGGTKENRITMTSYPGEEAILRMQISAFSPFWNFTRLTFEGTKDHFVYSNLSLGDVKIWDDAYAQNPRAQGYNARGNEFRGTMGHASNMYGDDIRFEGNYIEFTPHPDIRNDSAYSLYLYSGLNRVVKDNEIHGGAKWLMHYYDEKRQDENYKEISGVIEGNWLDASNNGGVGMRGALIFQMTSSVCDFNVLSMVIKNNVFFTTDRALNSYGLATFRHDVKNIKIYNNIFYNANTNAIGIISLSESGAESTIEIKNNIFSKTALDIDASAYIESGLEISNNLYDDGPDMRGEANESNFVTGDPDWISPGTDFHLNPLSPAIEKGTNVGVLEDYDHVSRPQGSGYDIGAFEFIAGTGDSTTPQTPTDLRID